MGASCAASSGSSRLGLARRFLGDPGSALYSGHQSPDLGPKRPFVVDRGGGNSKFQNPQVHFAKDLQRLITDEKKDSEVWRRPLDLQDLPLCNSMDVVSLHQLS